MDTEKSLKLQEHFLEGIKTNPGKRCFDSLVSEALMFHIANGIQIRDELENYVLDIKPYVEVRNGYYFPKN